MSFDERDVPSRLATPMPPPYGRRRERANHLGKDVVRSETANSSEPGALIIRLMTWLLLGRRARYTGGSTRRRRQSVDL